MSTEPISTIDEKKAAEEGNTTEEADWQGFFKNFSHGLITGILVGVVFIGSAGLFLTKVVNANILPTELEAEPYKNVKRLVDIELIYMNPVKKLCCYGLGFWSDPESYNIQEANFVNKGINLDFMENFKNTWLCSLKYKADPSTVPELDTDSKMTAYLRSHDPIRKSPFWTFEYETLKPMLCMSFTFVSNIFYYMNYLPEWATMLFCALFFSVILTIVYICNFFYGVGSHISHVSELWNNFWKPEFNKGIDPNQLNWNWISTCFFFFLYLTPVFWSAIMTPAFITIYTFYKALSANYIVRTKQNESPKEQLNFISFIKNVMYYKKTFIIILVMFNLMAATNEYLGVSYLPGVIIAVLILVFGMNILDVSVPEELYKVTNVKASFPPLHQPVVKMEGETNNCVPIPIEKSNTEDTTQSILSKLTNNPINVLNQTGGKIYKGGRAKIPKVKRYNIQLV